MPSSHLYFGPDANNNVGTGFEGLTVVDLGRGNDAR
jgi:hypothetical protein